MVGTTYTIPPMPPDQASTDYFEVSPLRVGVEYRRVDPEALAATYGDNPEHMAEIDDNSPEGGFTDEGVSIHIISQADGHEYLRFDVFVDEPHYHYVDKAAGTNTVVPFDSAAHGDMTPWAVGQLRNRLPAMLSNAGAPDLAAQVTDEVSAAISEEVATRLQEIAAAHG
jgi:hypothetical protein